MDYKENGNSYLLIQAPVEQIDASLVTVVSMKGLMKDISRTRNLIIGVNIGFIFPGYGDYLCAECIHSQESPPPDRDDEKKVRRGEPYGSIKVSGGEERSESWRIISPSS
ncbi:hypothetical protein ACFTAO_51260 [Paenibacillus rhizoplanae]